MPPSLISEEDLRWIEAEASRTDNKALKEACVTWRESESWDKSTTDALQVVNSFLQDNKPKQSQGPECALAGNSDGPGSDETEASGSDVAEGPARKRQRRTEGALVEKNGGTSVDESEASPSEAEAEIETEVHKDDDDDDDQDPQVEFHPFETHRLQSLRIQDPDSCCCAAGRPERRFEGHEGDENGQSLARPPPG
jgi:hypothetical protein